MESIVVTGASGAIGRRVVRQLAADPQVQRILALDRSSPSVVPAKAETHRVDLLREDSAPELARLFLGAMSIVHLAEVEDRQDHAAQSVEMLRHVLTAASAAGVQHVVLLSSALVYGAEPENPVPILETQAPNPHAELTYAVTKLELERIAIEWTDDACGENGQRREVAGSKAGGPRSVGILRPTTTLSERGASWVAKALRAASSVRPDQVDPPVQFLHHDDLASAVSLVTKRQLSGVYNVAPDGWIGAESFRELAGDPGVRLPVAVGKKVLGAARRYGLSSVPRGIEPYVRDSWIVANDKLRAAGWIPAFSNEEAFVLGTPAPPWAMNAKRRQEVALGVASAGIAGATAIGLAIARRLSR